MPHNRIYSGFPELGQQPSPWEAIDSSGIYHCGFALLGMECGALCMLGKSQPELQAECYQAIPGG